MSHTMGTQLKCWNKYQPTFYVFLDVIWASKCSDRVKVMSKNEFYLRNTVRRFSRAFDTKDILESRFSKVVAAESRVSYLTQPSQLEKSKRLKRRLSRVHFRLERVLPKNEKKTSWWPFPVPTIPISFSPLVVHQLFNHPWTQEHASRLLSASG